MKKQSSPYPPAPPLVGPSIPPRRCAVVHCWVTAEIQSLLAIEANRRGTHPDRLAADLITIIIGDGLAPAILDR